jgi:uncharacterized protein
VARPAPRQGRAARFFQALGGALEVTEFTPISFTCNETDVMVVIRYSVTARATGRSGTMNLHHGWRFRDGLICQYRGAEDTAHTADLLTP